MKRKKILFLVPLPPPVNGVSVMNQALVDSPQLAKRYQRLVMPIFMNLHMNSLGLFQVSKVVRSVSLFFRLWVALVVHRPQAVYMTPSLFGYAFYRDLAFIALARLFCGKRILHIHGQGITSHVQDHPVLRALFKFAFSGARLISLSDRLTTDLKAVYGGRPFVVHNGVADLAAGWQRGAPREDGPIRLLYLSNLCRFKGVLDYLEALALLKAKGLDFKGLIVGEESDLSGIELNERIHSLGLKDRVSWLGPLYGEDKRAVLIRADVFVFPSRIEAMPVSIIEAMQFSLPVVATRVGAVPDLVLDGMTGLLVEPNMPQSLAGALERILGDGSLRQTLGEAGRTRYLEGFSLGLYEKRMGAVFDEILGFGERQ